MRLVRRGRFDRRSSIIGPAAGQNPKDDDHLVLVVKTEADPPVADAQAPLGRVELPNVATAWRGDESVKSIQNPTLDRWIESL